MPVDVMQRWQGQSQETLGNYCVKGFQRIFRGPCMLSISKPLVAGAGRSQEDARLIPHLLRDGLRAVSAQPAAGPGAALGHHHRVVRQHHRRRRAAALCACACVQGLARAQNP